MDGFVRAVLFFCCVGMFTNDGVAATTGKSAEQCRRSRNQATIGKSIDLGVDVVVDAINEWENDSVANIAITAVAIIENYTFPHRMRSIAPLLRWKESIGVPLPNLKTISIFVVAKKPPNSQRAANGSSRFITILIAAAAAKREREEGPLEERGAMQRRRGY